MLLIADDQCFEGQRLNTNTESFGVNRRPFNNGASEGRNQQINLSIEAVNPFRGSIESRERSVQTIDSTNSGALREQIKVAGQLKS
jgi:hypothetical protein